MKKGIDLIAEERQKQINNDNVSGECNDTALEEQFKIWFEKQGQKYTWSEEDEDMF